MKSLFQVKILDHTFVTFEDYDTAFCIACKVRQAYRKQNKNVPFDVFKQQNAPGFLLAN